jgi:DNA modification methylase
MKRYFKMILEQDQNLCKIIDTYSSKDKTYWSFRGRAKRFHCHNLIHYPAMMVPEMQGELLDVFLNEVKNIQSVIDPFVGSGTTLGEALSRGLDFFGIDINPLAILACEVKSNALYTKKLQEKSGLLLKSIKTDKSNVVSKNFIGIDKWFTKQTQIELSTIYRCIKTESSKWARKVFWLSLSSTVRAVCNSRSSTYKLHIKPNNEIENIPSAISVFEKILSKNISNIIEQKELLAKNKVLKSNKSISKVFLKNINTSTNIRHNKKYDLLISSPPYGDNQTTVPYGQFSYLPLMWIDIEDIDNLSQKNLLANQNAIDFNSLGGSLKNALTKFEEIKSKSRSLVQCSQKIQKINPNNTKKLASFIYDLNQSLINILKLLKENAYMIWTLGNRRISNIEVPLDKIMRELLESMGCHYVYQIEREIPSKRMAKRNSVATTIGNESILIMRK